MFCVRYNPSAALRAAPPLTQGRLRSAPPVSRIKALASGRGDPSPTIVRFCQGGQPMVAPTKRYSFYNVIRFLRRFFFAGVGAKKKLTKRNAKGETRKRGLFEKSPLLNPAKTFGQLVPSVRRVHPRQRVSLSAAPQVPPPQAAAAFVKNKNSACGGAVFMI